MDTAPPDSHLITLGDIERVLAERNIPLRDVKTLMLVAESKGDRSSPVLLEIERYLRDADGHFFAIRTSSGEHVAATERQVVGRLYRIRSEPTLVKVPHIGGAFDQFIPGESSTA